MPTVLLIENEPAHLIALALILRASGYRVLEADSADEAVRSCQQHLGPIHVVVTKTILDYENASEVVARLESMCPEIRAVLISDEPSDELAFANTAGCAFLRTPFRADALADTIGRLLDNPKKKAASVNGTYGSVAAGKIRHKVMATRPQPSSTSIRSFSKIALAPLPALVRAPLKWSSITIALAAVVLILLFSARTPGPAPARAGSSDSVALTLTGEGNRLRLSWDGLAPGIRPGRCGMLWIADGSTQRRIVLDVSQLRTGTMIYSPQTNDVSVRLNISDANINRGDAVSSSAFIDLPQPGKVDSNGPLEQPTRVNSRYQQNKVRPARQYGIAYGRPKPATNYADSMSPGSHQTLPSAKEVPASPIAANLPMQQIVHEQILAAPRSPAPKAAAFSSVNFEAITESHLGGVMGKIPLLRRLHRAADFVPPMPVQGTPPTVPEELLRTLRTEVPLDVLVYLNKSGKVDYAELLSDITPANRDFATLAVFNARHWEFKPARSETRIVPGRAMLHYQFGNPLPAILRD